MEASPDAWRLRNKSTLKAPRPLSAAQIQPYSAYELFYYLNGRGWYQNRLTIGVGFRVTQNIKGDLYHFWQRWESNGGDTLYLRALGFKLGISF